MKNYPAHYLLFLLYLLGSPGTELFCPEFTEPDKPAAEFFFIDHPGFTEIQKQELRQAVTGYLQDHYATRLDFQTIGPEDFRIKISFRPNDNGWQITTSLTVTRTGFSGETGTGLPANKLTLLPATLAGDIFYLWATAGAPGATTGMTPAAPPAAVCVLNIAALKEIRLLEGLYAGQQVLSPDNASPVLCNLAPAGQDIILTHSHGYLTLDNQFRITPYTMRDAMLQPAGGQAGILRQVVSGPLTDFKAFSYDNTMVWIDSGGVTDTVERIPVSGFSTLKQLQSGLLLGLANNRLFSLHRERDQLKQTALPRFSGYITALGTGRNIWIFDLTDRRIKILSETGELAGSIKPLLLPGEIPFPEILEPLPDNSFLIGGNGKLWKCDRLGIPCWKMEQLQLQVTESLPSHFSVLPIRDSGSFILADPLNNRLIRFSGEAEPAAALLKQVYRRIPGSLRLLIRHYRETDQLLAAVQACRLLAETDLSWEERELVESTLYLFQKKQAACLADLARSLESSLMPEQAELFYQQALEDYRGLRTRNPADTALAGIIEELTLRRRELRNSLRADPEFTFTTASSASDDTLRFTAGGENPLQVTITYTGQAPCRNLTIRLALAGFTTEPATFSLSRAEPGEKITLTSRWYLPAADSCLREDTRKQLSLLISYQAGEIEKKHFINRMFYIHPVR